MHLIATLCARVAGKVKRDDGMTLIELAIASLLGAIVLSGLGGFLISSMNAGAFSEGMSATIDDVRNAMQRIEKETRGADSITWCAPIGNCLVVGAQTPTGSFETLRYTHVSSELRREIFNTSTGTWSEPSTVIERVTNTALQPIFRCDTQTSLLRVIIDLHIEPTPQSDPNLNVQTSIRPRNFPSAAICPAGT